MNSLSGFFNWVPRGKDHSSAADHTYFILELANIIFDYAFSADNIFLLLLASIYVYLYVYMHKVFELDPVPQVPHNSTCNENRMGIRTLPVFVRLGGERKDSRFGSKCMRRFPREESILIPPKNNLTLKNLSAKGWWLIVKWTAWEREAMDSNSQLCCDSGEELSVEAMPWWSATLGTKQKIWNKSFIFCCS